MNAEEYRNWVPINVHWRSDRPSVDWCNLGQRRFTDPFFEDTIAQQLRRPFSILFQRQCDLGALCELQALEPGIPPTGFIFHMSRCGSTLLAQMLAASPQNIVISEASPIDSMLRAHQRNSEVNDEQRIRWLRALVSAFARPRTAQEQYFFIKFDSWHTVELPLIQRAFPEVPWVFLYRDPIHVLVSHEHQMGAQMVPSLLSPHSIGLERLSTFNRPGTEYCAQILAHICSAALENLNQQGMLINYGQLPKILWERLFTHFRVDYSPEEMVPMQEVARFNAKNPTMYFEPDSSSKERSATTAIKQVADQWLTPIYQKLEECRMQRTNQESLQYA